MQRKLDSLDFKTTGGPVEFFPDTDLEGYLESQHSKFIWSSIEETKKEVHLTRVRTYLQTAEHGMNQFTARLESDWLGIMEMVSHSLSQQAWRENELETALSMGARSKSDSFQEQNPRKPLNHCYPQLHLME